VRTGAALGALKKARKAFFNILLETLLESPNVEHAVGGLQCITQGFQAAAPQHWQHLKKDFRRGAGVARRGMPCLVADAHTKSGGDCVQCVDVMFGLQDE
jgi:hypothetical protein